MQPRATSWRQTPKTVGRGHFGNCLVFAPDGTLYITSGDRKRFEPAQSLASNLGKVVRINSDGSIPSDNPFAGKQGALPDIWSYGLRNALSIAFPLPGEHNSAQLGLPDVLFFSLFLGAADRFGLRVWLTWILMALSFGATLALAVGFDISGLPALPLLSLAFIVANADYLWRNYRSWRSARASK